jgi:hypothetical protein
VPASIKLQKQYGDDLAVIFVESQGASDEKAQAFAWRREWMGVGAMWSTEPPVRVEGNMLPKYALLDSEGRLVSDGNPLADKKRIEETIAEQVKRRRAAPEGTPAKLAKAWGTHAKGATGAALAEVDKLAAEDPALGDAAGKLRARMVADARARLARAAALFDDGRAEDAAALGTALEKSFKGAAELESALATELGRQRGSAAAAEVEASKALAVVERKMLKGKPFEDANLKALERLVKQHAGTKAAERATRLVALGAVEVE